MRLLSQLERPPGSGILFSGNTGKVMLIIINYIIIMGLFLLIQVHSELPSNGSMELKLTLIPITPGLQVRAVIIVECGDDGYVLDR